MMLLFVHEFSSWPLLLLLLRRWPYSIPTYLWIVCQLLFNLCAAGVGYFTEAQ